MAKHLRRPSPLAFVIVSVLLGMLLLIALPSAASTSAAPLAAGPAFELVKNINPTGSSFPHNLTAFCCNRPVLFAADDGTNGIELWVTDGTDAGTFMAGDINPDGDSSPAGMVGDTTRKHFSANDGMTGVELWSVSGPFSGWTAGNTSTSLARDVNPGPGSSFPRDLVEISSQLYFTADDGASGRELWHKRFSTYRLADIRPGTPSSDAHGLTAAGSNLFFAANDGANGMELWLSSGVTDGSTVIASMVLDINPGPASSTPDNLTSLEGSDKTLYFTANDGVNGIELWKSDGTEAGTVLVKDINPGGSSSPENLTSVGGFFDKTLYFTANDGVSGVELWKSDGTEEGTVRVKDIAPDAASSSPHELASVGGVLLFAADDGTTGVEPWTSDGTEAGTKLIKDVAAGPPSSDPALFRGGGKAADVIFVATEATFGREWWLTDLTSAGTELFFDMNPGSASSSPTEPVIALTGDLIFAADVAASPGDVELRSVSLDQFEGLKITKTHDAGSSAKVGQLVTYTIVIENLGPGTRTNVIVEDTLIGPAARVAISEEFLETGGASGTHAINLGGSLPELLFKAARPESFRIDSMPEGSTATLLLEYRYTTAGSYSNTVGIKGDTATATASVTVEKREAAKLTSAAGVTSAGTVVDMTKISGGTIESPDGGCSESHLAGTILIAGAGDGPFADPDPGGCGWGPALGLPAFHAVDGVLGVAGLTDHPNTSTVYLCGAYVCTDLNGATLSADPGSPDFHTSLASATSDATKSFVFGGGCCDDVLTFGTFPTVVPGATEVIDRFVSSGAGDDNLECLALSGCTMIGGDGNDNLDCTGGGDCAMFGGDGNDNLDCTGGGDCVMGGGDGNDDFACAGNGACTFDGGGGDDTLVGGTGADVIWGGPGNDTADGKAGDDTYLFGPADAPQIDIITEGVDGGIDTLDFSALLGDDPVTFNLLVDPPTASHTNRVVEFNATENWERYLGGAGDDSWFIPPGVALVDGGPGTDTLTVDAGGGFAADTPGAAGSGTVTGPGGTITYVNIENVVLTNLVGVPLVPALTTWALGALALALAAAVFVSTRRRGELRQTS